MISDQDAFGMANEPFSSNDMNCANAYMTTRAISRASTMKYKSTVPPPSASSDPQILQLLKQVVHEQRE